MLACWPFTKHFHLAFLPFILADFIVMNSVSCGLTESQASYYKYLLSCTKDFRHHFLMDFLICTYQRGGGSNFHDALITLVNLFKLKQPSDFCQAQVFEICYRIF